MNASLYIQGFSALHSTGIYSGSKGRVEWTGDQSGPADVVRSQVIDSPFPGFGKMFLSEKLAFCAASLIFSDGPDFDGIRTGISLGTMFGSFSIDQRYMKSIDSGFPSPAYFSATLPSSPVAEASINFKIKGPVRVVVGGGATGICALDLSARLMRQGKADKMLLIIIEAVEPGDAESGYLSSRRPAGISSYGFLLSSAPDSKKMNRILTLKGSLKKNTLAKRGGEPYFFELIDALNKNEGIGTHIVSDEFDGTLYLEKE